jgi:hypothetical protein
MTRFFVHPRPQEDNPPFADTSTRPARSICLVARAAQARTRSSHYSTHRLADSIPPGRAPGSLGGAWGSALRYMKWYPPTCRLLPSPSAAAQSPRQVDESRSPLSPGQLLLPSLATPCSFLLFPARRVGHWDPTHRRAEQIWQHFAAQRPQPGAEPWPDYGAQRCPTGSRAQHQRHAHGIAKVLSERAPLW